jgi:murein DD-endopeptidase MepM/ murein hydrolase activator NlpD
LNKKQPKGNYVIIDHGNGEYSFLAHLKKGSMVVAVGDSLKSGQFIGLCGNSGNSSEPHLHYHLQNKPIF